MSGAHTVFQNAIVLRMLIAISDLHRERCPGRAVIEIAGEDLKSVLLPARGRQCAAARSAARHIPAHGIPVDGDPCGKSVDDAADGSAMGFPKNGDFQFLSECIAHRICPLMGSGFRVQGGGIDGKTSGPDGMIRWLEGCRYAAHPSCAFGAPLLQGAAPLLGDSQSPATHPKSLLSNLW